jgi:threonine/homoserine/homoserine lactone efflux protein
MLPVDPALYALFLGMMAAFAVSPGPANIFAVATGQHGGPRAALLGVAGMNAASLVWIGAAALGLGALVHAFPGVFRLIALAGAAYVAWLGAKALWAALRDKAGPIAHGRGATTATAFRDGFAVQLANPKAVVFFTAVLPPFVDPGRPAVPQLALLGVTVIAMDVAAMSAYGLAGGALASAMGNAGTRRAFSACVGALLLAAAAYIALRR